MNWWEGKATSSLATDRFGLHGIILLFPRRKAYTGLWLNKTWNQILHDMEKTISSDEPAKRNWYYIVEGRIMELCLYIKGISSFIWHHKHQWITHDRLHTIQIEFIMVFNVCKVSLLSHAWPFHHDYGVIWKKWKLAFQWCVHFWKK